MFSSDLGSSMIVGVLELIGFVGENLRWDLLVLCKLAWFVLLTSVRRKCVRSLSEFEVRHSDQEEQRGGR